MVVAAAHRYTADNSAGAAVDDLIGIVADKLDRLIAAQVERGDLRGRQGHTFGTMAVALDQAFIVDEGLAQRIAVAGIVDLDGAT